MSEERRFHGALSEDYRLIRLALPHYEELQRLVGGAVAGHPSSTSPIHVLDLGCGDGATSQAIISQRNDVIVTAVDHERTNVERASANLREHITAGRLKVVLQDGVEFLEAQPASSFEIVASALMLHNLQQLDRSSAHRGIFRVLKSDGLFVNADKYAEDDEQRFKVLQIALGRFFDAFVPLGKLDLLRDWVLHNVADQSPDRVMKDKETVKELAEIGFTDIRVACRHNMEALLTARKPVS